MILMHANALSISLCTRSTSDLRNVRSCRSLEESPSSRPSIEFEVKTHDGGHDSFGFHFDMGKWLRNPFLHELKSIQFRRNPYELSAIIFSSSLPKAERYFQFG
jgi:hypothetical protein